MRRSRQRAPSVGTNGTHERGSPHSAVQPQGSEVRRRTLALLSPDALWETGEVWLGADEYTFTDYKEAKDDYDLNMYYYKTRSFVDEYEEFEIV